MKGMMYNITGRQILAKTPFKLEPPPDEEWTVCAMAVLPVEGFQAIRYMALGGVHHPILDQGKSYADYGTIALRYQDLEQPEFQASAGLLMDRWVTLNNAMPDASVVKAGKLIDYLVAHANEMPSGPSVLALANAIDVAADARFRYIAASHVQISPPVKVGKESDDAPPVVKELGFSRKVLLVERRENAIGGPGALMTEPLEVELHIYVRKAVGTIEDPLDGAVRDAWDTVLEAPLQKKIVATFKAWHAKYPGNKMDMLTFGFVSKKSFELYAETGKWLLIEEGEIINHVRSTWVHQDDRNSNPGPENTLLVVMRCA